MKINIKFHIFNVYDYKGGELAFSLNLTYEEFIDCLTSHFEGYFEDFGEYTEKYLSDEDSELFSDSNYTITTYLWDKYVTDQSLLDYFYSVFSLYAGNSSTVEEWFVSEGVNLKKYELSTADEQLLLRKVKENYLV